MTSLPVPNDVTNHVTLLDQSDGLHPNEAHFAIWAHITTGSDNVEVTTWKRQHGSDNWEATIQKRQLVTLIGFRTFLIA